MEERCSGGACNTANNCYYGRPFGWDDLIPLYSTDIVLHHTSRTEMALHRSTTMDRPIIGAVTVIDDFPFLDNFTTRKTAIVRVRQGFHCIVTQNTCEDNTQSTLTQFSGNASLSGEQHGSRSSASTSGGRLAGC